VFEDFVLLVLSFLVLLKINFKIINKDLSR